MKHVTVCQFITNKQNKYQINTVYSVWLRWGFINYHRSLLQFHYLFNKLLTSLLLHYAITPHLNVNQRKNVSKTAQLTASNQVCTRQSDPHCYSSGRNNQLSDIMYYKCISYVFSHCFTAVVSQSLGHKCKPCQQAKIHTVQKERQGVKDSNILPILRFKGTNKQRKMAKFFFQSECLSMTNRDRRAENRAWQGSRSETTTTLSPWEAWVRRTKLWQMEISSWLT